MIKLSNIILEGRSNIITSKYAVRLFKNDNPSGFAKSQIYRGMDTDDNDMFHYIEPSLYSRRSAYTTSQLNYYTMLIDNLPSWKEYPKRTNSIICSTNINKASKYGAVFNIIPKEGAKIAVCPTSDIWYSFEFIKKFRADYQLDTFNDFLHTIVKRYMEIHNKSINIYNYKKLVTVLNYASDNKDKFEFQDFRDNYLMDSCIEHGYNNLLDYFNEYAFNPDINGFKLLEYNSKFKVNVGVEVWTESDSIMIPSMFFKQFKQDVIHDKVI